jgi:hypothetical protein
MITQISLCSTTFLVTGCACTSDLEVAPYLVTGLQAVHVHAVACPVFSVQKQQSSGSGFSLGFGSIGRINMRSSSAGGSKPAKAAVASSKPPVIPSSLLNAGIDDDIPAFTSTALSTR